MALSSSSPTTEERARVRGVLDSFLQRAALFTAIYLLVGNVFQQSYLRSLGLRVGLIDPSHLLPSFTDIYVLAYVTLVWGVASRFPDRWYNHVAEVLNLSTWRNPSDFISRGVGLLAVYLLFLLTNIGEILWSKEPVEFSFENLVPSVAFFSRPETALVLLVFGVLIAIVYGMYSKVRSSELEMLYKPNSNFMWVVLQVGLPVFLLYMICTFGISVPASYGAYKADLDLERMRGQPIQRITYIKGSGVLCFNNSDTYQYTAGTFPEAHFMGQFGARSMFVIFNNTGPNNVCLIDDRHIEFMQLADPK